MGFEDDYYQGNADIDQGYNYDPVSNAPPMLVQQGLQHMSDPNASHLNGMDLKTRMSIIEPLVRAQHFGVGGGVPQAQKGAQGTISTGKSGGDGSKAMGIIKMVGSLL